MSTQVPNMFLTRTRIILKFLGRPGDDVYTPFVHQRTALSDSANISSLSKVPVKTPMGGFSYSLAYTYIM